MTNTMRADERASYSQIQKNQKTDQILKSGIKASGAALSTAGAGLSGIGSKITPFLSSLIPTDLAMKGINKISPGLGNLLKTGEKNGLSIESGIEYLRDMASPKKENQQMDSQESAKENRNIIEQYSPELFQFINDQVRSRGLDPIQAGALAQNDPKFTKIIKKISEDHKSPWSNILQSVFGNGQTAQPQQQASQQEPNQTQQMGQQQSGNPIDQQIMSKYQNLMNM